MNTKHTPGPWSVKYGVSQSDFGFVVHEPTGGIVCGHVDYTMGACVELHKANAKLIAAAPDLLAALRDCLHTLADRGERPGIGEGGPVIEAARAAIAAATS